VVKPNSFDGSAGNPLRVLSKQAITVRLQAYMDPAHPYSLGEDGLDARRLAIEDNAVTLLPAADCAWHEGDTLNGHDLPSKKTPSKEACSAACLAEPSCAAVVWNAPGGEYGDSVCNLKWSAPPLPWGTSKKGEWACRLRPDTRKPAHPPTPAPAAVTSLDLRCAPATARNFD